MLNSAGQAFVRIGDSKHDLTADEIRELQIDKGQLDFEQEPALLVFPGDFNSATVRRYVDTLKQERRPLQEHSDEEMLEHRHLGKEAGWSVLSERCVRVASLQDPMSIFPGCKVRFLRVDGDFERSWDRYNIVKDIRIEGPIPQLIEETSQVLESELREFSRLGPAGKFFSAPEYPKRVLNFVVEHGSINVSECLRLIPTFPKWHAAKFLLEKMKTTGLLDRTSNRSRDPHARFRDRCRSQA